MSKKFLYAAAGIAALCVLFACSSPTPIVTQQEIDVAVRQDRLAALYDKVYAQWSQLKPSSKKAKLIKGQMDPIGKRLAKALEADIAARVRAESDVDNRPRLFSLSGALARLEPMKRWDAMRFQRLNTDYQRQAADISAMIAERVKRLNQLTDLQPVSKASVLDELANLQGGSEGAQYAERRIDLVEDLYQRGASAIETKRHDDAKKLLLEVQQIKPDYPGLDEQLQLLESGTFEQQFWDALGSGRPDEAYHLFYGLSNSPGFPLVRQQIGETASDISNYFIALGKKQNEQGLYADAFQAYQRARYIRERLELDPSLSKEEKSFLKKVEQAFEKQKKKKNIPVALGLLSVIEEMSPDNTRVKRSKRILVDEALELAAIKISAAPYSNATKDRAFGRGLSSKVSLYLLQKIPADIRIIERDQFESLYSKTKKPDAYSYLSYYYVQGEILESEVDTIEKTSNQVRRVVTNHKSVPNTEHKKWLELKKRQRKKTPEPPATVSVPVQEDINIKATIIKKVGVFSAIFRLVDPFTAKVIFVDSVTEKAEHEGLSIEGMELGEFKQEPQIANLPSDSEILEKLAGMVSEKIGDRLISELSNPENKYEEFAKLAIAEDNLNAAINNFAFATVLAESKGQDAQTYKNQLKHYALSKGL